MISRQLGMDATEYFMYFLAMRRAFRRTLLRESILSPIGGITEAVHSRWERSSLELQSRTFPFPCLVYLLDCMGVYHDKRFDCQLRPGHLIFIRPDVEHFYGPTPNESWEEIYFIMDSPLFEVLRTHQALPRQPVVEVGPVNKIHTNLSRILQVKGKNPIIKQMARIGRLMELLLGIVAGAEEPTTLKESTWLSTAFSRLQEGMSLAETAGAMGENLDRFRKRFRALSGVSPSHYQAMAKMNRARKLLTESDLSIKEISHILKFHDEFHFSKRFKKLVGLSPSSFRRNFLRMIVS